MKHFIDFVLIEPNILLFKFGHIRLEFNFEFLRSINRKVDNTPNISILIIKPKFFTLISLRSFNEYFPTKFLRWVRQCLQYFYIESWLFTNNILNHPSNDILADDIIEILSILFSNLKEHETVIKNILILFSEFIN